MLQLSSIMKATRNGFKEILLPEPKGEHIMPLCAVPQNWPNHHHHTLTWIRLETILEHKSIRCERNESPADREKKKRAQCVMLDLLDSQRRFNRKYIIIDNKCSPFEIALWICYQTLESTKATEKSHCLSVYCTWMDCSSVSNTRTNT